MTDSRLLLECNIWSSRANVDVETLLNRGCLALLFSDGVDKQIQIPVAHQPSPGVCSSRFRSSTSTTLACHNDDYGSPQTCRKVRTYFARAYSGLSKFLSCQESAKSRIRTCLMRSSSLPSSPPTRPCTATCSRWSDAWIGL